MSPEACLYARIHAPRARHDDLLLELVAPLAREVAGDPRLHSLFFVRYDDPDWHLRVRILGAPAWVGGPLRAEVERRLRALEAHGPAGTWEFAAYEPELERYGGERGMRLSERIFLHDSLACLDLIDAERRGVLAVSRREYSVFFVERFLDLLGFDRAFRLEFYRRGYAWALESGDWGADDLRVLEGRYRELGSGLLSLCKGGHADPEPERIARACLEACAPVVGDLLAAHRTGELRQDLVHLTGSLTHMHSNRLALQPATEAVLRFFMHRLHQDVAVV